jgi:DNA-binding NtrC family response regulator
VQPVAPAAHGRGETVLVIDDDDAVRGVVERILDRSGFHVLTTTNAEDALVLAAERPGDIDLVLSDVVMPGMLGTELAKRLRLQQPTMPVLLMSGYAPPAVSEGGSFEDGVLLVDKPFSAASLLRKVHEALGHS